MLGRSGKNDKLKMSQINKDPIWNHNTKLTNRNCRQYSQYIKTSCTGSACPSPGTIHLQTQYYRVSNDVYIYTYIYNAMYRCTKLSSHYLKSLIELKFCTMYILKDNI